MSFTAREGARIYYEVHGQGPAVVFCHGAGSNAATWWQQIPVFAEQYTCITIDNRGFGRSSMRSDAAFTPDDFADDVVAVMEAVGIRRAAIVGQSLGGMTALRVAFRYPERVWAMACCDSPMGIRHDLILRDVQHFLSAVEAESLETVALARSFVQQNPALTTLYGQINNFNPMVSDPQTAGDFSARLTQLLSHSPLLELDALSALQMPILILCGSEDPIVKPSSLRDVFRHFPNAQFAEIIGCGHSPYFEKPREFNNVVLGFLKRIFN